MCGWVKTNAQIETALQYARQHLQILPPYHESRILTRLSENALAIFQIQMRSHAIKKPYMCSEMLPLAMFIRMLCLYILLKRTNFLFKRYRLRNRTPRHMTTLERLVTVRAGRNLQTWSECF